MPDIGYYHPLVVHFAVALLISGVIFRCISLTGKARFTGPAAATLLLAGTLAAVASVQSGMDAHGPAERIPGAGPVVHEHEEQGELARNIFLLVAALEIVGLLMRSRPKEKLVLAASALVGVIGLYFLFEAAEEGGELVYAHAGGVGVRSGEEADVGRLLLAGIYHQAALERQKGDGQAAAELVELALKRFPDDTEVRFMAAESLLVDRKEPEAALRALDGLTVREGNRRLRLRLGLLRVDALAAAGDREQALASLKALQSEFPESRWVKEKLETMKAS